MVTDETIQQIDTFIKSIPKRTSHYRRTRNNNKYYLSPELNVSKMHKLYPQQYEPEVHNQMELGDENEKPKVSYDYFYRHFNSHYNLSFGKPRSDTCQTCDSLNNQIQAETNDEKKKDMLLEKKAAYFYTQMKTDIKEVKDNNRTAELLCFDYQQNMPLPHLTSGDVFFKRQLWEYNFCIHSSSTGLSHFFMYDETEPRKGQNEVVSFIHYYLFNIMPRSVNKLYLYSDNCSSQNKNNFSAVFVYFD